MNSKDFLSFVLLGLDSIYIILFSIGIWSRDIFKWVFPGLPKSLRGEIVLVTGGANGIGRALCKRLVELEKNLTIIIWDVNEKANLATLEELKDRGVAKAFAFKVDVSNRDQVAAAAGKVRSEIGDVTMLFNNVGIPGNVTEGWLEDPKIIEKVFAINIISHCWTLREFLPSMISNGRGHIIETCSMLGHLAPPSCSAYVSSKYAIRGYIESLKKDVRLLPSKPKINFTMVYPGYVDTDMTTKIDVKHLRHHTFLTPVKPEKIAVKIVDGIRCGKESIYFPGFLRQLCFLHDNVSADITSKFMDILGVTSFHIDLMSEGK